MASVSATQVRLDRATIVARHERECATLRARHFAELQAFDSTTAAQRAAAEEKSAREDKTSRAGSKCKACGEVVGTDFEYCMDDGCDEILCLREECLETHEDKREELYICLVCSKRSCYTHLLNSYCYDCEKYGNPDYQCCDLRDGLCNMHWNRDQDRELSRKRARYEY
jgi:hypothetical protein